MATPTKKQQKIINRYQRDGYEIEGKIQKGLERGSLVMRMTKREKRVGLIFHRDVVLKISVAGFVRECEPMEFAIDREKGGVVPVPTPLPPLETQFDCSEPTKMKTTDLRQVARERKISLWWNLRRHELLDLLFGIQVNPSLNKRLCERVRPRKPAGWIPLRQIKARVRALMGGKDTGNDTKALKNSAIVAGWLPENADMRRRDVWERLLAIVEGAAAKRDLGLAA